METSDATAGAVHHLPGSRGADRERVLWSEFRSSLDSGDFHQRWLNLQCHAVEGVRCGLVLGPVAPGAGVEPLASWPPGTRPVPQLLTAADHVLREGRALALQLDDQGRSGEAGASHAVIAHPVDALGELVALVALEVEPRAEAELQRAMRTLAWGSSWLALHALGAPAGRRGQLETLLTLAAVPLEHDRLKASATALASELATRLRCDRVSIGLRERGQPRVIAVSHSPDFDRRANVLRAVEAAMSEALDQEGPVLVPPPAGAPPRASRCHEELVRASGSGTVASFPMSRGREFCGAITLERGAGQPFSAAERELVEAVAGFTGPVLEIQRRDERWLGERVLTSLRGLLARLVGPRHVGFKLGVAAALGLFAFLAVARGDFRVTAPTVLEARVLRAAVAPFDGYVAEAPARAGDLVRQGDLLARLEDHDLVLERARSRGELAQLENQYRRAMLDGDAANARILAARIDQTRTRLELVADQLSRTRITAPFDGIVVSGDLTHQLGAPLERGDALFEVAPLDEYRVVLRVDERDVDEIQPGLRGSVVFSAFPHESLPISIETVTPVSSPADGHNAFRVEAALQETPDPLRPGMEGIAKVHVDRRRLIWIWTHQIVDWVRLAVWNWLP